MTWANPPQPQTVSGAHTSAKARVIWHEGQLLIGDKTGWTVIDAPDPPQAQPSGQRRYGAPVMQYTTAGVVWNAAGCSTCGWQFGGPAANWISRVLPAVAAS